TGLVVLMAGLLSSPDVPPVSVQSWAKIAPADFLATAATELDGTSGTATYGPPYNHQTGAVQQVGPVNWQTLSGVTQPVTAAPTSLPPRLPKLAATDPPVGAALAIYNSASLAQRHKWATAYGNAVTKVKFAGGNPVVPPANDGPVPALMSAELTMARNGSLDTPPLAPPPSSGPDLPKPPP